MNFTPFSSQFAGSIPAAAMHQFTTAKFAQNITAASNGTQMGQVVGVLSGGEGGVHYLRPVEGGTGFQHQQQQLITLPITMPGAKPGDPQQTVQIQVMNPNMSNMNTQGGMNQPKYQMTQIPIQTFQQGELGTTVLTVAYTQQDGSEGVQIIGNSGLPEGIQVVAAIQPQDMQQMLSAHLSSEQHSKSQGNNNADSSGAQGIQISSIISGQQVVGNMMNEDNKKNIIINNINNNNNNNAPPTQFRIKQEVCNVEDPPTTESNVSTPQWSIAPGVELAEYINRVSGSGGQIPVSLQQFLRLNADINTIKREVSQAGSVSVGSNSGSGAGGSEMSEGGAGGEGDGLEEEGCDDDLKDSSMEDMMQQTETGEVPMKIKKKKKYKKKPPKPKKPKPGQVVIATSLDGTTLYCCPECHMAYCDKEQLEQHLVGHKIERRYICGICGAGLKRREHLERHKLGHNPDRPFVCSVCLKGFKRKEHLNLHYVIHSGEKTEICQECGKGFYRKDHLRKHARSHATRRAREEQQHQQQQLQQQHVTGVVGQGVRLPAPPTLTPNNIMESEITIHVKVPTSNIPVPVQISVPHHIVSMANSNNGSGHQITIKPDMEEMLLQQLVSQQQNRNQLSNGDQQQPQS